nr:deoxyribonuclease IV [Tepidibacillus decaturensis]
MKLLYFGSHVSIRKGYLGAAVAAKTIGAKAFQYFPKNPRGLTIKKFDRTDAERCAAFTKVHGLITIAHTSYPVNLAAEGDKQKKIIQSILNDLEIVEACQSIGLVVHFGVYKGKDLLQGYKNIISSLNMVLNQWNGKALILLENQAGQSAKMGMTLEELVYIRNLADSPEKIGFCLDTCHAFASGLWNGENWDALLEKGKHLGYFDHLKAIHLNDSMFPTGSYRDRHANIGKGYVGEKGFKQFLNTNLLNNLPFILETPESSQYTHQQEIDYLKKLVSKDK